MKNKLLFLFILFLSFNTIGQADTIRLGKIETSIFWCSNETVTNWYICLKAGKYYLANVKSPQNEVQYWFDRYLDSQNILRSKIIIRQGKEFFAFEQPNNPGNRLYFEILRMTDFEILTQSMGTGEDFNFLAIKF